MPDSRQHRGAHPEDHELFARGMWPQLQAAVHDFSWLLSRGYATPSALKMVGDRFRLNERQRLAVLRCSCSDQARAARLAKQLQPMQTAGHVLWLDGFNVITTIEAALAGGAIIVGRDGCYRDMASMHGSYRKVAETESAIRHIGQYMMQSCAVTEIRWWLDRPVSNSGRLRTAMLEISHQQQWSWSVDLVDNPDRVLKATDAVVVSADGNVLDECQHWLNVTRPIIETSIPQAWMVPVAAVENSAR